MDLIQYVLATVYSAFSPAYNMAAAVCTVNNKIVPCPEGIETMGSVFWIAFMVVLILTIAATWKVFVKAGKPGWASIIPIYNTVVMLEIVGKPVWWIILAFIPFVNIVINFIIIYNLSKSFGRGSGFTLGLIFLPFIFYPILGFGGAMYSKPNNI